MGLIRPPPGNLGGVNWLEFALLHVDEPCTVRVEAPGRRAVPVGPCVIARRPDGFTVLCPPDTVAPPGSRITMPAGDTVEVVTAVHLAALGTRLPEHQQLDVAGHGVARRPCRASGRPG
ncbi:hypothetical protein BC793_1252 [Actinoplanes xinjiangensis]|jgi:hypothetical protein|uniref:Uncharacterized protein n=1 Tax=Actinoplanes xinjiangensis TaxID=512350 RepID=A0A316FE81_9ACTN|nr:hypothetical protein BC793_1252 [Actinoplanes xinjiangensis]GIF42984.1 hypothetical protein Axi01nite_72950 [Actinoplanes xinjiangensis]